MLLGDAFDPGGYVLMERRAREPVAMLGRGELVGCDPVLKFRTLSIREPEPGPDE